MAGIQLKAEIALVNDIRDLLLAHDTRITQNATAISLLANQTQIDEITGELSTLQAELLVQANAISTKVSQTDYTGNTIASLINQSATTIKLQASKIALEGLTTINSKFKVLLDGTIEAVDGKFSGTIESANIIGTTITGGIINGTTITTAQDMTIGQNLNVPIYAPTTLSQLVGIVNGVEASSKGMKFGSVFSGEYRAFITAVDSYILNGTSQGNVEMFIKSKARLELISDNVAINSSNFTVKFGSTFYTITRDSNGFLKAN